MARPGCAAGSTAPAGTGREPARDATGHRWPRAVRLQPDPLGRVRPTLAPSLSLLPAPFAQHSPPGLNPSRSSSSSPHHPGLPGWSCSPGPGQSPPSIIRARAAPPPRLLRRSEAERAVLCCAGRAPPPPARCPRSSGECCGRGVREEGSRAAPAGPWGAAGGDEAPPPFPAAGGRSWPGERGPFRGGRRASAGGGAPWVRAGGRRPSREAAPCGKGSQGARLGERPVGTAGWRRPEESAGWGGGRGAAGGQVSAAGWETRAAARRGDAAGPRGARAGPPAERSGAAGTGYAIPPRGSCVLATAGERSGPAVSHLQMNREERREQGRGTPGDLRVEGKPLHGEEEEGEGGRWGHLPGARNGEAGGGARLSRFGERTGLWCGSAVLEIGSSGAAGRRAPGWAVRWMWAGRGPVRSCGLRARHGSAAADAARLGGVPEAVLPLAARCAPGQIAPARPGWPSVSSAEVSSAVSRGPHPRAGDKGQLW